jgi:hypothetical protein
MVEHRGWLRVVLALLAVIDLVTGLWAVLDPLGWYKEFPGFGQHWVAGDGPFNRHLALDAGAGFLAVAAALVVALVWARREVIQVALVALLGQDLPHFAFHLVHHPNQSVAYRVVGIGGLGLEALVAGAALVAVSRGINLASPTVPPGDGVSQALEA